MSTINDLSQSQALIVLGMHRSGTSAWTRLLNIAGLYLGEDLLGSNSGNEKGHWEHHPLMLMNNFLLEQIGHSWDGTRFIQDSVWQYPAVLEITKKLEEIITNEFSRSRLWGVKDPRLCRLMPVWIPLLNKLGVNYRFLIVIRHPYEVAISLKKRNGFSIEQGLLIWLINTLEAERETRGFKRCFASYDGLLIDWKTAFSDVVQTLDFRLAIESQDQIETITDFITPALQHNKAVSLETEEIKNCGESLITWAETAYNVLQGALEDPNNLNQVALDLIFQGVRKRQSNPTDYGLEKLFDIYRNTRKSLVSIAYEMTSEKVRQSMGGSDRNVDLCDFYNSVAEVVLNKLDFSSVADCRQVSSEYGSVKELTSLLSSSLNIDPKNQRSEELLKSINHKVFSQNFSNWQKLNSVKEIDAQLFAERMMMQWVIKPVFHFVVIVNNSNEFTLLAQTIESLDRQFYKQWHLTVIAESEAPDPIFAEAPFLQWLQVNDPVNSHPLVNAVINQVAADWISIIPPGFKLLPHSLLQLSDYINLHQEWLALYTDEAVINSSGECLSHQFKPDFNLDYLLSYPSYIGHSCFFRKDAFIDLGGIQPSQGLEHIDIFYRVYERYGEGAIGHLSYLLAFTADRNTADKNSGPAVNLVKNYLARQNIPAQVNFSLAPGGVRISYAISKFPLVSIIVVIQERAEYFISLANKVLKQGEYANFEIIVVSIDGYSQDLNGFVDSLKKDFPNKVQLIKSKDLKSYSSLSNIGAKAASGELFLFINDDIEVVQSDWLTRLVSHVTRDNIEIAAPKMVQPESGKISDVGQVLGLNGTAASPTTDLPLEHHGYMARAVSDMNCSSVSGHCFITKAYAFHQCNGFDEAYSLQDTAVLDYCLKIRKRGGLITWTPHVVMVDYGKRLSWERDYSFNFIEQTAQAETEAIWKQWLPDLASDPAYNRNLSLAEKNYSSDPYVPISWDVNFHPRPRIIGFPTSGAAGDYRVIVPLAALSHAGIAQTSHVRLPSNNARILTPVELERLQPDSIVLHMAINDAYLRALKSYKKFNPSVFKVFAADDLISDVPIKSAFYKTLNTQLRDSKTRLRKALSYCDRLIVSTVPLAEAFSDMIADIKVIPNRLQRSRWQGLRSLRQQGDKPRVGWAGAQQHQGDLELISEVIKATSQEVDWVFFGMCLDEVRPYIKEYYQYVPINLYPEKLASLNLDLAVAPLEDNSFNQAKSNLRLLEYGVLGWPVICSDVNPYKNAPVICVPNNVDDWVAAIRAELSDTNANAIKGDLLKSWVEANYMIEDHLGDWLNALT